MSKDGGATAGSSLDSLETEASSGAVPHSEPRSVQSGRFQISELTSNPGRPADSTQAQTAAPSVHSTVSGRFHIADLGTTFVDGSHPLRQQQQGATTSRRGSNSSSDPLQLLSILHHRVKALMEENKRLKQENMDLKKELREQYMPK